MFSLCLFVIYLLRIQYKLARLHPIIINFAITIAIIIIITPYLMILTGIVLRHFLIILFFQQIYFGLEFVLVLQNVADHVAHSLVLFCLFLYLLYAIISIFIIHIHAYIDVPIHVPVYA